MVEKRLDDLKPSDSGDASSSLHENLTSNPAEQQSTAKIIEESAHKLFRHNLPGSTHERGEIEGEKTKIPSDVLDKADIDPPLGSIKQQDGQSGERNYRDNNGRLVLRTHVLEGESVEVLYGNDGQEQLRHKIVHREDKGQGHDTEDQFSMNNGQMVRVITNSKTGETHIRRLNQQTGYEEPVLPNSPEAESIRARQQVLDRAMKNRETEVQTSLGHDVWS